MKIHVAPVCMLYQPSNKMHAIIKETADVYAAIQCRATRVTFKNKKLVHELEHMVDVKYLNVQSLNLKTLPKLPPTLISLDCSDNELTKLPNLPGTLVELNCSENNLIQLPNLSWTLERLDCSDNQLRRVAALPPLKKLRCKKNI